MAVENIYIYIFRYPYYINRYRPIYRKFRACNENPCCSRVTCIIKKKFKVDKIQHRMHQHRSVHLKISRVKRRKYIYIYIKRNFKKAITKSYHSNIGWNIKTLRKPRTYHGNIARTSHTHISIYTFPLGGEKITHTNPKKFYILINSYKPNLSIYLPTWSSNIPAIKNNPQSS